MKGVTFVQCFQYWLKLCAIGIPALVLLIATGHGSTSEPVAGHPARLRPPHHGAGARRARSSS